MVRKTLSLVFFIISYLLLIFLPRKRMLIAVFGAILLILTGVLSLKDAFFSINWNVMGIFVGTLIVAGVFMNSRVPAYIAEIIVSRAKNTS